MKKIILSTFLIALSSITFSQKNVVKLGLFGLASKNVKLQYERVLTNRMSVQLSGSFLLNREMPDLITEGLASNDETNTAQGNTNVITSSFMKGVSIIPELRIYSKKKDGAPRGFYFGPYLKYGNYSVGYNGIIDGDALSTEGSVRSFGLGLSLGAHFLIAKRVSIDWNFISLGVNSNNFTLELTNSNGYYYASPEEMAQMESDIQNDFSGIPGLGSNVDITLSGNRASISSRFFMPAIRSGLTIGFAF